MSSPTNAPTSSGSISVTCACDFDRRGVLLKEEIEIPFTLIKLQIEADGPASHDQLMLVAAELAKYCPIAKIFRAAGTIIEEEWVASA
jgi:putative redox protein